MLQSPAQHCQRSYPTMLPLMSIQGGRSRLSSQRASPESLCLKSGARGLRLSCLLSQKLSGLARSVSQSIAFSLPCCSGPAYQPPRITQLRHRPCIPAAADHQPPSTAFRPRLSGHTSGTSQAPQSTGGHVPAAATSQMSDATTLRELRGCCVALSVHVPNFILPCTCSHVSLSHELMLWCWCAHQTPLQALILSQRLNSGGRKWWWCPPGCGCPCVGSARTVARGAATLPQKPCMCEFPGFLFIQKEVSRAREPQRYRSTGQVGQP